MGQDLAAGRIDVAFESYVVGKEAQKSGAYAGLEIKVIADDDRIAASREPGQTTFPCTMGNETLGKALDDDIAELRASSNNPGDSQVGYWLIRTLSG